MLGILPELTLTILGLLVLVVDFLLPPATKEEDRNSRHMLFAGLSIVGFFITWGTVNAARGHALPDWARAQMTVDAFAVFFKVVVLIAAILTVCLTPPYLPKRIAGGHGEFYALLIFAALGMFLMASATDLITLYVALEFTSLCIYVLSGYMKHDPKSAEAGMKCFLIGVISSGVMLYGMSLLYGAVGSTQLTQIGDALTSQSTPLTSLAIVMVLAGFAFKLAIVPFHQWMPDTFEGAPTPFVAYLSVAPKAAAFAMVMRVFFIAFGKLEQDWALLIAVLAALTMTVGNLAAIPQKNLKRMLAYSSIAQAGYMLIALAAFNMEHADYEWMRASGIMIYLLTYVFMNVGAFGVAVLMARATGSEDIESTRWMIKRHPLAAIAFLIFGWSLAGLPPTAGFIGKYFLFSTAIDSGLTWLALVGVINSVISVYYYFNVVRLMFFPPPLPGEKMAAPAEPTPIVSPFILKAALWASIIGTIAIGIYPDPVIQLAKDSVMSIPREISQWVNWFISSLTH